MILHLSRRELFGLLGAATLLASLPSSQAQTLPLLPLSVPLGVNLEAIDDWSHSMMFVNAIKSARPFGSPDAPWDMKAKVDAQGWPTQDAATCVMTNVPGMGGTYEFSCLGRALVVPIASKASVQGLTFDPTTGQTRAQIIVSPQATQLFLSFRQTQGGVRDIRLIRPGYPVDTTEVFYRPFLTQLQPFTTLRLMDYLKTNSSPVKSWSDRARPEEAQQSRPCGASPELAVDLANQTHKDLWFNIPDLAGDDYLQGLAQMLEARLDPDRVVYLEYSNEVWNPQFAQNGRNHQAAKDEVHAGGSLLNKGGDDNTYYWAWKRVSSETLRISRNFRQICGAEKMGRRYRVVLASQIANPFMLRLQLKFIAKEFGPPRQWISGVAGAPYFGLWDHLDRQPNLSPDQVIKALANAARSFKKGFLPYIAQARFYALEPYCYEGGSDMVGEASLGSKIAANDDPRMGEILENYLRLWFSSGGGLFCYYNLCSDYGKDGSWGLTRDICQSTVKTEAIGRLLDHPPMALEAGLGIPGEWPAAQDAGRTGGKPAADGELLGDLGRGNCVEYLLRVPQSGLYRVVLETQDASDQTQLALRGSYDSMAVQVSAATQWASQIQLSAGQQTLQIQVTEGRLALRKIRISN